jgi:hypothetical protein
VSGREARGACNRQTHKGSTGGALQHTANEVSAGHVFISLLWGDPYLDHMGQSRT